MQIVVCGLGGQGALFLSRVLARAGRNAGTGVIVAETHGMSQRGGSVAAFVKLGDYASSLIYQGTAGAALCLEASQAAAGAAYLRRGSGMVINAASAADLDPAVRAFAERRELQLHCVDAMAIAAATGVARSHNVVLLGFAAGRIAGLPDAEALATAIADVTAERAQEYNARCFAAGRAAAPAPEVPTDA